jgi:effector-binding domain-containing protein
VAVAQRRLGLVGAGRRGSHRLPAGPADGREAVRTGGLDQTGPAGGLYDECLFQHEPGQATVFIPVTTPRELGRIEPILVPAAEVAVTTHYGSMADIDLAYAELGSYIAGQELAVGPRIREYYHCDHTHTTDHTQRRTEVAWPIIDVLTPKAGLAEHFCTSPHPASLPARRNFTESLTH